MYTPLTASSAAVIECGGDSGLPIVQYITYILYSVIEPAFHDPIATRLHSSCTTYSCCTNTPCTQYHMHHVSKYTRRSHSYKECVLSLLCVEVV